LTDLKAKRILGDLIQDEPSFTKDEVLETLRNCSDPRTQLIPRLREVMKDGSQLQPFLGEKLIHSEGLRSLTKALGSSRADDAATMLQEIAADIKSS
jgi:hypothetical protein